MRPIGPRRLNTQPTTDVPIILDWYNHYPALAQVVVDEALLGALTYVAEYTMTDPFGVDAAAPQYQTLGAGTLVGTLRTFTMPVGVAVTAVRVRTTGGVPGALTYYVTQGSSGG